MTITESELTFVISQTMLYTSIIIVFSHLLFLTFSRLLRIYLDEKEWKSESDYRRYKDWLKNLQDDKNGEDYKC